MTAKCDSEIMKQALAILFALALAFSQPLASAACAPAAHCCGCGGKMKCCVRQAAAPDREAPAAPAPSAGEKDFQTLLPVPIRVIAPLASRTATCSPASHLAPLARSLPLFARDCAFLI